MIILYLTVASARGRGREKASGIARRISNAGVHAAHPTAGRLRTSKVQQEQHESEGNDKKGH